MSSEEMSRFVMHLMEQLDAIREELRASNAEQQRLNALVLSLTEQLHESQRKITDLVRENEDLQSSARVSNKHRFGSSSQKSNGKIQDVPNRDDDKEDFDGTMGSVDSFTGTSEEIHASSISKSSVRPSRKRCSSKVMSADYQVFHKALTYMHTFWKQLFRYRDDGNYTIDTSLAERSIRPMDLERKNSLFFCSTEGAKASAIFHTIIETCKQLGMSARDYIKNFLKAVSLGRTDWENLTPSKLSLV